MSSWDSPMHTSDWFQTSSSFSVHGVHTYATMKINSMFAVLGAVCLAAVCIVYNSHNFLASRESNIYSAKCSSGKKRYRRRIAEIKPIEPPWMSLLGAGDDENRTAARYVWVKEAGGRKLGNQLSNYAALFGVAWRNKRIPLWTDGNTLVRTAFNIRIPLDEGSAIEKDNQTRSIVIEEPGWGMYNNETENLPDRNVTLATFLQSWKYYRDVEDQLRVDLTFKPDIIKEAEDFINSSTPTEWADVDFVRVVIHVRRGDYVSDFHYSGGWPKTKKEYLDQAMEHFRSWFDRVQFVVISDDIPWCKATIDASDVVFSEGHSQLVDMAIASLCDHAIITIGSYGLWAAWFANGITITQRDMPIPGSLVSRQIPRDDYYRAHYIGL